MCRWCKSPLSVSKSRQSLRSAAAEKNEARKGEVISRCKCPLLNQVAVTPWHTQSHACDSVWVTGWLATIAWYDTERCFGSVFFFFFNLRSLPVYNRLLVCWNVQNGAGPHPTTWDDRTPFTLFLAAVYHEQNLKARRCKFSFDAVGNVSVCHVKSCQTPQSLFYFLSTAWSCVAIKVAAADWPLAIIFVNNFCFLMKNVLSNILTVCSLSIAISYCCIYTTQHSHAVEPT